MTETASQGAYPSATLENALRAKVTMENFYENLLVQDRDRNNRWKKLEMSMEDMGLSNDEVSVCGVLASHQTIIGRCGGVPVTDQFIGVGVCSPLDTVFSGTVLDRWPESGLLFNSFLICGSCSQRE